MEKIVDKSIDVGVPVSTAYNQWTQFEEFPRFMEGVTSVTQIDDTHLHWRAEVLGKALEWDAEISEQTPDKRIGWRSTMGTPNTGVVEFSENEDGTTRVRVWMEYDAQGLLENVASMLQLFPARVEANLKRFKSFIEARSHETGAWRGEVKDPEAEHRARPGASGMGGATHG